MPFVYLAYLWKALPDKVPTHWNYKDEIDHWGDKYTLVGMLFILPDEIILPVFITVIILIVLVSVVCSYVKFKKIEKMEKI
ncbi:DUF1648 domain-containing protein [Flavobacterium sp. W1B]|uniref:DUF1648 domain-containing protein n=1 Tax=Flavobacterium sp. W1B TaxID=3394146 RepID=UPI0039BC2634